jgi:hypothetical protein
MAINRNTFALATTCSVMMVILLSANAKAEMRENAIAKYARTALDMQLVPQKWARNLLDTCRIPEFLGMAGMNDQCKLDRATGVSECRSWISDYKDSYTVSHGNLVFSGVVRYTTATLVTTAWVVAQVAGAVYLFQTYDALKVCGVLGTAFIALANVPRG